MVSDLRVVRKALKGNKIAFGKLVEFYRDQILFLTYDYLGNYEEAKDAAQDVFVKAYENLKQFNQDAKFKTWLYRIAINTSLDYLRKRKSKNEAQNQIEINSEEILDDTKIIDLWDDIFNNAMSGLSEKQYSAIVLKYFHDKSATEISEILECDINTVRVHLHRAIEKLKQVYRNAEK